MSEYDDLVKEYRQLAKRADQRLVRLEDYQYRDGFATATKWAYSKAMRDIKRWSGEEAKRFNVKPPANVNQLKSKIADIESFLESATSSMKGIKQIYKSKADTVNTRYGTNFSWEDLANYYSSGMAEKLSREYGSKTALKSIAEIQKKGKELVEDIKKHKEKHLYVEDKILDKTVNDILNKKGLDISMFF